MTGTGSRSLPVGKLRPRVPGAAGRLARPTAACHPRQRGQRRHAQRQVAGQPQRLRRGRRQYLPEDCGPPGRRCPCLLVAELDQSGVPGGHQQRAAVQHGERAGQTRQARDLLTVPGNSISSIARLLGVSRFTLYKYLPEPADWHRPAAAQIPPADGIRPA